MSALDLAAKAPAAAGHTAADWGLAVVGGAAGALIGVAGLVLAYLLNRKAERARDERLAKAEEQRRVVRERIAAMVLLVENCRGVIEAWTVAPTMDVLDWRLRVQLPIANEIQAFGVRMVLDAPDMSLWVRRQSESFRQSIPQDMDGTVGLALTVDVISHFVMQWVADPSRIADPPTIF